MSSVDGSKNLQTSNQSKQVKNKTCSYKDKLVLCVCVMLNTIKKRKKKTVRPPLELDWRAADGGGLYDT